MSVAALVCEQTPCYHYLCVTCHYTYVRVTVDVCIVVQSPTVVENQSLVADYVVDGE